MILNLRELFAGGESIPIHYDMDMCDYRTPYGEQPFREPVAVRGEVRNRAGLVTIQAEASFRYHTLCDRCLKEISEPMTAAIENTLAREVAGDEPDEHIIVCRDETLDMDELVRTNVTLSLPMKHLCSEDCLGLCPVCGKDLNEGSCGCKIDNVDPGLTKLKDFIL